MSESSWIIAIGFFLLGFLATYIYTAYRSDNSVENDIEKLKEKLQKNKKRLASLEKEEAEYKAKYPVLRYTMLALLALNAINLGSYLFTDYRFPSMLIVLLFAVTVLVSLYNRKVQKEIEKKWI